MDSRTNISNLHGITKLECLPTNIEKVDELFRQVQGLINQIGENNISDIDYIQSLEKSMTKLCNWIRKNKQIFVGKQYKTISEKIKLFKKLLTAKYDWLERKEKHDMQFEIKRLNGLVDYLQNKLRENGISVGVKNAKKFDEDEWVNILWTIIDTSKKPASAKHKLCTKLNETFADWHNDDVIQKFYRRANKTIEINVSEERFNEKKKLYPQTTITKSRIMEMVEELKEIETIDFQDYTKKYEEYSWIADEAGYLDFFEEKLKD